MEKSHYTTPRVFLLMRMMSHFFCMESVQSWVDFLIVLFMDCVQSWVSVLFTESVLSWSRHQKLQEDWIGYKGYQSAIIMILQSTCRYSSTGAARINPGHGTKNCKRIGLGTRGISQL